MNAETINIREARSINIGLDDATRQKLSGKLAAVLADTYNLYLKTQYYHWNVTGPHFHSLHEMFEEQYQDLAAAVDVLAERVRSLGMFAPGTFREFKELGEIKEDSQLPGDWEMMVNNLIRDNETLTRRCRDVMEVGEKANDGVTHDLMIERMGFHEKTAWMLRSTVSEARESGGKTGRAVSK
jgi:starvation-inducible DNA-binding protein